MVSPNERLKYFAPDKRMQGFKEARSLYEYSGFLPKICDKNGLQKSFIDLLQDKDFLPKGSSVLIYDHGQHTQALNEMYNLRKDVALYHTKDLRNGDKMLHEQRFDVIAALQARRSSENQFETWKDMYTALNVGGVLLIDTISLMEV